MDMNSRLQFQHFKNSEILNCELMAIPSADAKRSSASLAHDQGEKASSLSYRAVALASLSCKPTAGD